MISRFDKFARGQWNDSTEASDACAEEAATASRRRRGRADDNDAERRALRALKFVQLGELSTGRQALEGAELAPGNAATLAQLRRRQDVPRELVPDLPRRVSIFNLDEALFGRKCQVGQTWCRRRSLREDMRPSSPIVGQELWQVK